MIDSVSFVHALHLFSPSLPIGAFAFSQGLESAVESGYVSDAETLQRWCEGVLKYSLSTLDCYCARRAYQSDTLDEFSQVNAGLLASRETHELLMEDMLLGAALKKWAVDQGMTIPHEEEYSVVCLYGWIASSYSIPEDMVVAGILWNWLDNQAVVAAKAIPLGQIALQHVLSSLKPVVATCVEQSRLSDLVVPHSTVPFLSILSAQHETQYSRLFRS